MGIIVNANNLNVAALQASGVYVAIKAPPGNIVGQPTDVLFIEGTAPWGPVNVPVILGSGQDINPTYGGIQAASLTDQYDLCRAAQIAFQQSPSLASLQVMANRITDGSDVAAFVNLDDTTGTPLVGIKISAKYSGTLGNKIKITIAASQNKANAFTVTVSSPTGGSPEIYSNIPGSGSTFWQNLANAINNGQSGIRPKSSYVVASNVNSNAIAPAVGTFSLASGTDGRAVNSAHFVGSDDPETPTGIYTARANPAYPPVGLLVCAGLTDNTVFPDIQAMCDQEGIVFLATLPAGTDDATAISTKKSDAIDDYNCIVCKGWKYWFDPVNQVEVLCDPAPFIGGRIATLSPEVSPANQPIYGVVGQEETTTRNLAGIGNLQSAGIQFINKGVNGGQYWGLWHGQNSSSNPAQSRIEYSRMTNFIARSLAAALGKYIGAKLTHRANDKTMAAVKAEIDNFLFFLADNDIIDSFVPTVCDLSNNSETTVGMGYLFANVTVKYVSSVQFFVVDYQGGETVSVNVTPVAA